MSKVYRISKKIVPFVKTINVEGDKSLSIRWVLFSSIADGISSCKNLLNSEDVMAAISMVKKLGVKVKTSKSKCIIHGKGLYGFKFKSGIKLNAKISGTAARLIIGLLANYEKKIKIIGDKSFSKRDFKRITDPLSKFGVDFKLTKKKTLPLTIAGNKNLSPIKYFENKGSAQCKSSVILAALKTKGITYIKAKKSRNHSELLCKYLKLPIKVLTKKNFDYIKIQGVNRIKSFNYKVPSDISSAAFFIVLTVLAEKSKLIIKNVNVNPSRTGIITILKKMGASIVLKNRRNYKGEAISDISVKSTNNLKPINCPSKLNSGAIDEFLLIFLLAAKAKGTSYFRNLDELNKKESPRLKWGSKILSLMGVKNITNKNSIKIFGNPKLKINKKIIIKDYLKDHRVFMTSVIASLVFGGNWKIHDKDSFKTSFPSFLKTLNQITNAKKN